MIHHLHFTKSLWVLSAIFLTGLLFVKCVDQNANPPKPLPRVEPNMFAGSAACSSCHAAIYQAHVHTAHYLTSRPSSRESIKGSFEPGKNLFIFNPNTAMAMEKRGDSFYQVQYDNGVEKKARKFDITVGSGTKGQTFLYWWKDTLFQLPVTYFTATGSWSNSPGYPGHVAFGRPVTSRCLECHTTYAQSTSAPDADVEKFDHQILYGVDCEKCHGPAAKHVRFQQEHPGQRTAKYIIDPAGFTRQQSLDLCALCHGGRLEKTRPSFEFQAGDSLTAYFHPDTTATNTADIDVHGNQYGLLAASKCFRNSGMTCLTCHDPHTNESGRTALFSQRCLTCHNDQSTHTCKMTKTIGPQIKQNCIDCHMPVQSSRAIMVLLQGESTPVAATMRSHYITTYPEETKKFLLSVKKMVK